MLWPYSILSNKKKINKKKAKNEKHPKNGCFVSNKFNTIFEYLCHIVANWGYVLLLCIYGSLWFSNLGWQKLRLWRCNRKVYTLHFQFPLQTWNILCFYTNITYWIGRIFPVSIFCRNKFVWKTARVKKTACMCYLKIVFINVYKNHWIRG